MPNLLIVMEVRLISLHQMNRQKVFRFRSFAGSQRRRGSEKRLKTVYFMGSFQQDNFTVFQEPKLRNRIQGIEKPTTSYSHYVIDISAIVNLNIRNVSKLEYLYRGLRPSVLVKHMPVAHDYVADYFSYVKIYTEAAL